VTKWSISADFGELRRIDRRNKQTEHVNGERQYPAPRRFHSDGIVDGPYVVLSKEGGTPMGIRPRITAVRAMQRTMRDRGMSIIGFTQDNTRRPSIQKQAFSEACVAFAFEMPSRRDSAGGR